MVCGAPELEDEHVDTMLHPAVLIEVLSRSTNVTTAGCVLSLVDVYEGVD